MFALLTSRIIPYLLYTVLLILLSVAGAQSPNPKPYHPGEAQLTMTASSLANQGTRVANPSRLKSTCRTLSSDLVRFQREWMAWVSNGRQVRSAQGRRRRLKLPVAAAS